LGDLWVTLLIAVIAAVPGALSLIIALRKAGGERIKLDGDASGAYMHAAREAAADVLEKGRRIDELEVSMQALKAALQQTQDELEIVKKQLTREIAARVRLQKLARDLYDQVKFIGVEPVVQFEELDAD
jgi:proteasome assembly chaperone (PAC2) family protein